MKKIIGLLLVFALLSGLTGCSSEKNNTVVGDVVDQVANVAQATDENVLGVKNGSPALYPNVTYEQAFGEFFSNPTWKYFQGTNEDNGIENADVVEFTGTCNYQGVDVKCLIQFMLSDDKETFNASYISFNDVPQNELMLSAIITKAFEDYIANHEIKTNEDSLLNEEQESVSSGEPISDAYSDSENKVESIEQMGNYDNSQYIPPFEGYWTGEAMCDGIDVIKEGDEYHVTYQWKLGQEYGTTTMTCHFEDGVFVYDDGVDSYGSLMSEGPDEILGTNLSGFFIVCGGEEVDYYYNQYNNQATIFHKETESGEWPFAIWVHV